jgi:hypothetical protein
MLAMNPAYNSATPIGVGFGCWLDGAWIAAINMLGTPFREDRGDNCE